MCVYVCWIVQFCCLHVSNEEMGKEKNGVNCKQMRQVYLQLRVCKIGSICTTLNFRMSKLLPGSKLGSFKERPLML